MTEKKSTSLLCLFVLAVLLPNNLFADPQPGDIFKVYNAYVPAGENRPRIVVADPNCNTPYCKGKTTPVVKEVVLDINDATRAELVIEQWGGHIGSANKSIKINDNRWLALPVPKTPTAAECYFYNLNGVSTEIPLSYLKNGINSFYFTTRPGQCKAEGYPGWFWVYSVRFIIYYNPSKPHPNGTITSPASGESIGDKQQISISVDSPNSVSKVELVGYYEDFDWEGNGVYRQWHCRYYYDKVMNIIGQSNESPYSVIWDTSTLPDQKDMKIAAMITDSDGMSYMTEAVENLSFDRSHSIKMYKPSDVPQMFCGARNKQCLIAVSDDPAKAKKAWLYFSTWSGSGDDREVYLNNNKLSGTLGLFHDRYFAKLSVPTGFIKQGLNEFRIVGKRKGEHAFEINWPGPVLMIEYEK